MIRAVRRTSGRTGRFLLDALAWREPDRQYALVAWSLLSGAVWLGVCLVTQPVWAELTLVCFYLVGVLAAVCAIDARYGIIPNSLVVALVIGQILHAFLTGQGEGLLQRSYEAMLVFAAACLFRTAYRWLRGYDGLGFGDVKFATAGVLWIGIEGVPGLLLVAVLSAVASQLILKAEGHDLDGKQAISFGPHLAIGIWLIWIADPLQFG